MRHTRFRLRVQSRELQNVSQKYSHQRGWIRKLFSHIFEISKKTFSFISDVSNIFSFVILDVSKKLFSADDTFFSPGCFFSKTSIDGRKVPALGSFFPSETFRVIALLRFLAFSLLI